MIVILLLPSISALGMINVPMTRMARTWIWWKRLVAEDDSIKGYLVRAEVFQSDRNQLFR